MVFTAGLTVFVAITLTTFATITTKTCQYSIDSRVRSHSHERPPALEGHLLVFPIPSHCKKRGGLKRYENMFLGGAVQCITYLLFHKKLKCCFWWRCRGGGGTKTTGNLKYVVGWGVGLRLKFSGPPHTHYFLMG